MTLCRTGLLDRVIYLYDGHITDFDPVRYAINLRRRIAGAADGMPIPPTHMIWLTLGRVEVELFLESGRLETSEVIMPLLEHNNLSIHNFHAVLDFGCGCGRLIRHWQSVRKVKFIGTDCNASMIRWCSRNLKFAEFRVNHLSPPLSFPSEAFDFIYCRSVFTHLSEALQHAWIRELSRVLTPKGTFLFTVRGDSYASNMTPDELSKYQKGNLVVQDAPSSGRNECWAYHSPNYVRSLMPRFGFDVLDWLPSGRVRHAFQDTWLTRKQ